VRIAVLVVVCSVLAALPVGLVWWLLAPLTLVQKRADGLYRVAGEGDETAVAADGWFAGITLVAGIAVALLVYLRTRPGRVVPLVALVAGGLLGALAAWQLGHLLGPGSLEATAAGRPLGARFRGPLDVSAYGVLLAWPMATVITYFAVAAGAEAGEHEQPDDGAGERAPAGDDRDALSPDAAEQSGPR
jgi:hypothetical protein